VPRRPPAPERPDPPAGRRRILERRLELVVAGLLLEGRARTEESLLVERAGEELQAHRKAVGEAAREGQAGKRLAGTVKMSARYICRGSPVFSPRRKAGVGVVGVAMTSQPENAAPKSRRMRVRTFCARR